MHSPCLRARGRVFVVVCVWTRRALLLFLVFLVFFFLRGFVRVCMLIDVYRILPNRGDKIEEKWTGVDMDHAEGALIFVRFCRYEY